MCSGSGGRWGDGVSGGVRRSGWCSEAVVLVGVSASGAGVHTLQCLGHPLLPTHIAVLSTRARALPSACHVAVSGDVSNGSWSDGRAVQVHLQTTHGDIATGRTVGHSQGPIAHGILPPMVHRHEWPAAVAFFIDVVIETVREERGGGALR